MAKTPAFRFMGGKARLRNWLTEHFPKTGSFYCEPFLGRGNVFFKAIEVLNFDRWILSDIDTSFIEALRSIDVSEIPDTIVKSDFPYWRERNRQDDPLAAVLAPRITFAGKGYAAGWNSGHTYQGKLYRPVCQLAQDYLKRSNVSVIQSSWEQALYAIDNITDAFAYLDPPYLNTVACYENIDHQHLIETLNKAECRWAISGYTSELYDGRLLYKNRYTNLRNSEIKSYTERGAVQVEEVLWTNY